MPREESMPLAQVCEISARRSSDGFDEDPHAQDLRNQPPRQRPFQHPEERITGLPEGLPEDSLVLFADFHLFLQDGNPVLIRAMKDALVGCKATGKCIIRSSGSSDGGTSARVFGSFISWMQEKTAPVFVVATANDVTQLPPELLRKGRWDDLFFVDLPNEEERRKIWEIQIRKRGRDPAAFNLQELVEMGDGYTGAEIEQAFIDAMYAAFAQNKEPDTGLICRAAADSVPLSKLMGDQIGQMRSWAHGRCRIATSAATTKQTASTAQMQDKGMRKLVG